MKQKDRTKNQIAEDATESRRRNRHAPRWAVIALCVGWGLFLLLVIFAILWQFGDLEEKKRIKEGIFLPGETVDLTVPTQVCVAETVIVGEVPSTYLQLENGGT